MNLIQHLESSLGKAGGGWTDDDAAIKLAIACFEDQPVSGVWTYCTLGLSFLMLQSEGQIVRQEMIFAADERFESVRILAFFNGLAEDIVRRQRPLVRGDIAESTDSFRDADERGLCLLAHAIGRQPRGLSRDVTAHRFPLGPAHPRQRSPFCPNKRLAGS